MSHQHPGAVRQFSIFTANRLGQLRDLVAHLGAQSVNILAITVLDTTDSSIIRCVLDDPDKGRRVLEGDGFSFTEKEVLVVEIDAATSLNTLMAALLEAELNINYLYCFIPHPQDKSLLALSMEDNEVAERVLTQHQFRLLRQADISR